MPTLYAVAFVIIGFILGVVVMAMLAMGNR